MPNKSSQQPILEYLKLVTKQEAEERDSIKAGILEKIIKWFKKNPLQPEPPKIESRIDGTESLRPAVIKPKAQIE